MDIVLSARKDGCPLVAPISIHPQSSKVVVFIRRSLQEVR